MKQLWLLEAKLFITFSLLVIHVYIEAVLLFDENLLKITKQDYVISMCLEYECLGDSKHTLFVLPKS